MSRRFEGQKRLLHVKSARKAPQASSFGGDAMAGDDEEDGISRAGLAHGPGSSGMADLLGDLTIRPGLSRGDPGERLPNHPLKGGPVSEIQGEVGQGDSLVQVGENPGLNLVQEKGVMAEARFEAGAGGLHHGLQLGHIRPG